MTETDRSKKQEILETAARLFRDRGYGSTSMRDLAKGVHLQASSLYNHISGKQEILQLICFQNAHRFLDGIDAITQRHDDPVVQLEQLIRLHLDIATGDATAITSFNDEWRHLEEPHLGEFIQLRKQYETRFRAIIRRGIDTGAFVETDTYVAFQTLIAAMRWVFDRHPSERALPAGQVVADITKLLLHGLKKG